MTRARRPLRRPMTGVAAALAVVAVALTACSPPASQEAPQAPSVEQRAQAAPAQVIGGGHNVFTQDVSSAPLAPNSATMVRDVTEQVTSRYNGVAGFNVGKFSASMYVVDENTPRVDVAFDDCQDKDYLPDDLHDGRSQFLDVPIPKDAQPATGTDKALSIFSPSTDQLWEFWVTEKDAQGNWSACWGGRIDNVSQSRGTFTHPYGATASGLPMVGSMVTLEEARHLQIEHAVSLVLVETGKDFSYPANRSDGRDGSPDAVPLGSRIRLDPNVDVDSLPMVPLGKAIAKAAQKYGFLVVDTSGAVSVIAQSGQEEQARTGRDPWRQVLGGTPTYEVMKGFPWEKTQVVAKDWGKPAERGEASSS